MSKLNCLKKSTVDGNIYDSSYMANGDSQIPYKIAKLLNREQNINFGTHLTIHHDTQLISYKDEILCEKFVKFERIFMVMPVHHSLCYGKKNCFRILTNEDSGDYNSIIFSCLSQNDRNGQIKELMEQTNKVNNHQVTQETSIHLTIQEARNLSEKHKYYCELKLDDILYARTSVKKMTDMLIWCETFDLKGLPKVDLISVTLCRLSGPKDKQKSFHIICQVNMSTEGIDRYNKTDKWYSPSPILRPTLATSSHLLKFSASCNLDNTPDNILINSMNMSNNNNSNSNNQQIRDTAPLIRISCRYFPLTILPSTFYGRLLHFLQQNGCQFLRTIELSVTSKFREELIRPIVHLASADSHQYWIENLLAKLVCSEASGNDVNLILRGNSMGSKAIECFLKIECYQYLEYILKDLIDEIQNCYNDVEIFPFVKSTTTPISANILKKRQKKLENIVSKVMLKIFSSYNYIPIKVLRVFHEIRMNLVSYHINDEFIHKVMSACFFLRLVCPAIKTPFLFNLLPDYSENQAIHRAFTLVAKCVQNIANFASIDELKEEYMREMVLYCRQYYNDMNCFLSLISRFPNLDNSNIIPNSSSSVIDYNNRTSSYHRDLVSYESARLCHHLDYVMHKFRDIPEIQKSNLEHEMEDIISEIKSKEEESYASTNTIDKIKRSLKQIYSNYKQLEMTSNSSGYSSTLTDSFSGSISYIDSLFRAQQSEENSATVLLELEKQKVDIIKEIGSKYSFNGDCLDCGDMKSICQMPNSESNAQKPMIPMNLNHILSSESNFLQYIKYAESVIFNSFDTNYLRDYYELLVQVMKINSDIQINMMKRMKLHQ